MADRTGIRTAPLLVGLATLGLAMLMVVLPARNSASGLVTVSWLIVAAGILDFAMLTSTPRRIWPAFILMGSITIVAGLVALSAHLEGFFSVAWIVMIWLGTRGLVLLAWAVASSLPALTRAWLLFNAAANVLSAALAFMPVLLVSMITEALGPSETLVGYAIYPAVALLLTGLGRVASAFMRVDDARA